MNNDARDRHDSERLTRWVRQHGGAVYGFLLALVQDRHVAEDLLQEAFFRAWQARRRYTETGRERAYLLRIADRLVRDWRRRAGREIALDQDGWMQLEPADQQETPLESLTRWESRQQLKAALDVLSEPQRRTFLLRYFGNLQFREIAGILGCPVSTVLSHSRRGLLALRRLLVENSP